MEKRCSEVDLPLMWQVHIRIPHDYRQASFCHNFCAEGEVDLTPVEMRKIINHLKRKFKRQTGAPMSPLYQSAAANWEPDTVANVQLAMNIWFQNLSFETGKNTPLHGKP